MEAAMLLQLKRSCCKSKVKYNTHTSWLGRSGPIHDFMEAILFPFDFVLLFFWGEAKYCHRCGDRLQKNVPEGEAIVDELIEGYFHHLYPYQAILILLEKTRWWYECMPGMSHCSLVSSSNHIQQ